MNFQDTEFETSCFNVSQLPAPEGAEIVFSGRSNVGKSSMINKLVSRKNLARVSSAPGKTASINLYRCGGFRLADLPGYGFAKVSRDEKLRWAELVEGYFAAERPVALVIQLVDVRRAPSDDDMDMIRFLSSRGVPFIVAETKCDKLGAGELALRREKAASDAGVKEEQTVFFSAKTGEGAEKLRNIIIKHAEQK